MKNMKKILAVLAAVAVIAATLVACTAGKTENAPQNAESDLAYVQGKGEMIIGITYFEPMDYIDKATGEVIGFEADFARAVCEKLGVTPKFQEISWEAKETELAGKTIDCVWNGMTITPERQETMSITNPYMNNKQVVICKKENAEAYAVVGALEGKTVVAEQGSAGEETVQDAANADYFGKANYVAVKAMKNAMMEVKAGTADAAVIDYVTGIGSLVPGSDYEDLVILEKSFADEQYGIAFRKGSDITAEVNKAIDELKADGTLQKIAEKYNLSEQLVK